MPDPANRSTPAGALAELTAAVRQMQAGDLSVRLPEPDGPAEVADLTRALDRLAGTLRQREEEQQRKGAALAESEARFRTMFETSAIGIGIMGLDLRVISINPALCQMYGYTCEELIGRTSALVLHPDDTPRAAQKLQDLVAGKVNQFSDERRYIRKNGEAFWTRTAMSMVRDAQGAPLYIVGMVADINEERLALAKLQESEARFRAMYNNAAVGMATISLDRRILSVNETSARITGYSVEELLNTDPGRLSHPDDAAVGMAQFGDLIAGKIPQYQMEKRFIRKSGEVFWGRVSYSAVPGADGRPEYLVGLIEDISQERLAQEHLAAQEAQHRRQLEQRIAERTEELSAANERLREKAAQDAVAAERTRLARDLHDAVTQTLFSTTLIADVLPDIWEMNPAEGKRRLEEVRRLTRGALAEMRTLLVELRPNALTEIPLPTLLRQLTEAMVSRAPQIAIHFTAQGDCSLPADVQVGFYRIAQEALNNVVKHARASQAVVSLRLCEPVRLIVADNGAGFDPGAVSADHLGLRIMRERAEAIGARLSVYSEPGEGTQISVLWGKG